MNLNQVTVPSLNVEQSIVFYKILGLELIVHTGPHYARFQCANGATFSIQKVEELSSGHGVHVYFETEDLDAKVQELKAKGVEFIEEPNDKPWLWREAHLADPDGNAVILYFAGENRLNPPWKLK